jgi:hypothetical protein
MSDDLNDQELIRQMAAYIAGMESESEPSEEGDDVEHWKREAESAEERFQIERQAVYDERRKVERFVAERDREFERANKLSKRVQELEAQRNEVKLLAQKRITDAMGKYGEDWSGDWLDEAVERLTRKRSMTVPDLVEQLSVIMLQNNGSHEAGVRHLLSVLGVTLRE